MNCCKPLLCSLIVVSICSTFSVAAEQKANVKDWWTYRGGAYEIGLEKVQVRFFAFTFQGGLEQKLIQDTVAEELKRLKAADQSLARVGVGRDGRKLGVSGSMESVGPMRGQVFALGWFSESGSNGWIACDHVGIGYKTTHHWLTSRGEKGTLGDGPGGSGKFVYIPKPWDIGTATEFDTGKIYLAIIAGRGNVHFHCDFMTHP